MLNLKTLSRIGVKSKSLRAALNSYTQVGKLPVRSIVFQFKKEKESYYQVLGIKPSSSQEEIKKAFYALAK